MATPGAPEHKLRSTRTILCLCRDCKPGSETLALYGAADSIVGIDSLWKMLLSRKQNLGRLMHN